MRRGRRGFTLVEVIAAFAITLLMLGPIAGIIGGVAGSFAGLERSTQRRIDLQSAGAAALAAGPLRPGSIVVGEFRVDVEPALFERRADLARAGWALYAVSVYRAGQSGTPVLQTLRMGRL